MGQPRTAQDQGDLIGVLNKQPSVIMFTYKLKLGQGFDDQPKLRGSGVVVTLVCECEYTPKGFEEFSN